MPATLPGYANVIVMPVWPPFDISDAGHTGSAGELGATVMANQVDEADVFYWRLPPPIGVPSFRPIIGFSVEWTGLSQNAPGDSALYLGLTDDPSGRFAAPNSVFQNSQILGMTDPVHKDEPHDWLTVVGGFDPTDIATNVKFLTETQIDYLNAGRARLMMVSNDIPIGVPEGDGMGIEDDLRVRIWFAANDPDIVADPDAVRRRFYRS